MRKPSAYRILTWIGTALLIVGLVLSAHRLVRYASTLAYAPSIPTASAPDVSDLASILVPILMPGANEETESPAPATAIPAESVSQPRPTEERSSASTPGVTAAPAETPVGVTTGVKPIAIHIPAIGLDAPIMPTGWTIIESDGGQQAIWDVPDERAAGWHDTSAYIGVAGNTVLNGHNATRGEVFRDLYKLEPDALILIDTEDGDTYAYRVGETAILREAGQPLEVRLQNARYIQRTDDERLTLVTCHPYGSLANRLLVIAYPAPHPESAPLRGE